MSKSVVAQWILRMCDLSIAIHVFSDDTAMIYSLQIPVHPNQRTSETTFQGTHSTSSERTNSLTCIWFRFFYKFALLLIIFPSFVCGAGVCCEVCEVHVVTMTWLS